MGRKDRLVVRVRPLPLRSGKQSFTDHQFQASFGPESAAVETAVDSSYTQLIGVKFRSYLQSCYTPGPNFNGAYSSNRP